MKRSRLLPALIFPLLCACGQGDADLIADAKRMHRVGLLVARIEEPGIVDALVEAGELRPVLEAMRPGRSERVRHLAAVAAGRIGGPGVGEALLALFDEKSADLAAVGMRQLYAAVGFTQLADPAFAVDLIERLSSVDPNNAVAARALEEGREEYFTVDAQLCDALLAIGVWNAEEDLLQQMLRRHRIRVLIDANAVLRRRTGLSLPFRYNGSYSARAEDVARWRVLLRSTRGERIEGHPLDATPERLVRRIREVVRWLGERSVNQRYISYKILPLLGSASLPYLIDELRTENPIGQRQAAHVLGRIGDAAAGPALRAALSYKDDDARAEALTALWKVGDRGALPLVRRHLVDSDPEVRAAAADFLGAFGAPEDREAVSAALERERAPSTSAKFLCALLRLGDRGAAPRLIQLFSSSNEQLDREAALAALEEVSGKKSRVGALATPEERRAVTRDLQEWFR